MRKLMSLALVAALAIGLVALPAQAQDVDIHVSERRQSGYSD